MKLQRQTKKKAKRNAGTSKSCFDISSKSEESASAEKALSEIDGVLNRTEDLEESIGQRISKKMADAKKRMERELEAEKEQRRLLRKQQIGVTRRCGC